jgi:hypothetical protein
MDFSAAPTRVQLTILEDPFLALRPQLCHLLQVGLAFALFALFALFA